ncbi:MAG: hypothetical protein GF398_20470 [Chitinivibrionales bacterium]|nr:hypothetical protein [Chitinivibrionales bacterium]
MSIRFKTFVMSGLFCASLTFGADWNGSGRGGAVAAGKDYRAVQAGLDMLKAGGNAADASVATLLALSVTDYGSFCIGAEIPYIIYDAKKQEVKVLCGLGVAPLDSTAYKYFMQNGIPKNSPNKKVSPVPGPISLFFKVLEEYGTKSFDDVAQPVLAILDAGGRSWYNELAATLRKLIQTESTTSGTRIEKLRAARERFYKGDIAETIADWFAQGGSDAGFITREDLAAYQTRIEDPVTYDYNGYVVNKCDTWTQGPVLLQMLAILKRFDLKSMGHLSAEYLHTVVEAEKLAFADRDKYYGDPLFVDVPMNALLSDEYNDLRADLITDQASTEVRPGNPFTMQALSDPDSMWYWPGGTTTCAVTDQYGNMVVATPSGNGNYTLCSELGVHFARRLRCLNTMPGHPNQYEPGKRPRITLTPTLVLKDGKPVYAISVAGGDKQDQTALNILLNLIEFGMEPTDAVTAPRFETKHQENTFNPDETRTVRFNSVNTLRVNTQIGSNVRSQLSNKGHDVATTNYAVANPVMIEVDPTTGVMTAAGDWHASRKAGALTDPVQVHKLNFETRFRRICTQQRLHAFEITVAMSQPGEVQIEIYDPTGRRIHRRNLTLKAGNNAIRWTGATAYRIPASGGLYVAAISTGDETITRNFVWTE